MSSTRGLKVLFVEDNEDDTVMVLRELKRAGFAVTHERVETHVAMASALDHDTWDLVLSDHALPAFSDGGGLALITERGLDLPFIIVSGAIGEEHAAEAMRSGAHDYIMKGNLKRLVPAIERELRETQARQERRETAAALARAEENVHRLAAIVESSDDAIVSMSADGTIQTWNPGAERLYGYAAREVVGLPISIIAPTGREDTVQRLVEQVVTGRSVPSVELRPVRKGGAIVDVMLALSPIRDADGAVVGVSGIARDITERKRFELQLQHLADHDALTGLPNRRRFEQELGRAVALAGRYGISTGLAVIDLDNFKYVNDSLGHRTGDELIRGVATLLRRRLRQADVVARLGGDEFAILLPHTSHPNAERVMDELLHALRGQTLVARDRKLHVTTSAGLVVFADNHMTADELLASADQAMYEAKEEGRDRLCTINASPINQSKMEARFAWGERVRRALAEDLFVLHEQPIVDLRSGAVSRHEILIRMQDEHGGVIAPGAFLGTAERFGLINDVDQWVIARSIALIEAHRRAGRTLHLEVNLSGKSIDDPALPALVEAELATTSIDPACLTFEITETAAITNMDLARTLALRLTELGCRFALDDFGAGFGSFYYLKHLPLHFVKIDGGFIRDLAHSETDRIVVKAMVEIAAGMGLRTIAEFVEDAQTYELLCELGVDYAQGYHIARPQPVQELWCDGEAAIGA